MASITDPGVSIDNISNALHISFEHVYPGVHRRMQCFF